MTKSMLLAIPVVVLAWLFVGLGRYAGDHEVASAWDPFIKHKPTITTFYKNPAQVGLDMVPIENLDASGKKSLIEYCQVRYGTDDIKHCYDAFLTSRV
ncbi:hypothetical protein [Collimonas pratensis]|uniref:hypothetical protein n=1 Tax=Collimonas pratensis TaxID=279113 RepID=UPI00078655EE|nr:hypothetical protein [Collimonas pratensis]